MDRLVNSTLEQLENGTPMDKIIELKCVYKLTKVTLMPVRDGNGWFKGIPRLSDSQKAEMPFHTHERSRCLIEDGKTFDLNDAFQKATWEWVKHSPYIADTFELAQIKEKAEFYVYQPEKEANDRISRREKLRQAMNLIAEDPSTNYVSRLLSLNIDAENESIGSQRDQLETLAESNPQSIIDLYQSPLAKLKHLLYTGRKLNVIRYDDIDQSWIYGQHYMGSGEASAMAFLNDPKNMSIVNEINMKCFPQFFDTEEDQPGDNYVAPEDLVPEDEVETMKPSQRARTAAARQPGTKARKTAAAKK